jgi:LAO/AO transport system kinase
VVDAEELRQRITGPDSRVLPRLATLVENEDPRGISALDLLYPLTGAAHVVGITGPPGAGKSTLVAALIEVVRAGERRIAVIAVDPSSTLTGGAVLGDRIRMMDRYADEGVFVRSMASRGRQGGLAWATAGLVHLLDVAGYPLVFVETVGTGQDGTDIASLADTVVVVEAPGLGDGVQAIKSGLLEVGDVVVVNKSDQPGAEDALRTIRGTFEMGRDSGSRRVPVLGTVAPTGRGIPELLAAVDAHDEWLTETGERARRRERGARAEVFSGLRGVMDRRLDRGAQRSAHLAELIQRVANRELSPHQAIQTIASGIDALPVP